jgi:hypothetical protein
MLGIILGLFTPSLLAGIQQNLPPFFGSNTKSGDASAFGFFLPYLRQGASAL